MNTLQKQLLPLSEELLKLSKELKALSYGDFLLASGQRSNFYFDGRKLAMSATGLERVVNIFGVVLNDFEKKHPLNAVGGPAVGSVPIVGALAYALKHDSFFVRRQAKEHGTGKLIEGVLPKAGSVALLEDTVTTGGSLLNAVDAVRQAGVAVKLVLAILDRGGVVGTDLERRGIRYFAALTVKDGELQPNGEYLC